MKHLLLTSAMLLTMSVQLTHAAVHYVKAGATGDGTSWATASGSIDDMLEKAVSGDEIWIATGTYKPVKLINSSKKNSRAFTLKEGVSLYGGFAGTETFKADRTFAASGKAYDFEHETILSGDDDVPDVWERALMYASNYRYGWRVEKDLIPGTANNSNHILYSNVKFEKATVINGFTLKGGNAMVWKVKAAGGALYAKGNVHLAACKVLENSAYFTVQSTGSSDTQGGAVRLEGSGTASIEDCYFARNFSHSSFGNGLGGAVYAINVTIARCEFEHCVALDAGGALVNVGGTVSQCRFSDCYAFTGGAVYNQGTMTDSHIFDCRGIHGGGLFNTVKAERVVVAGCHADTEDYGATEGGKGGGIYNQGGEVFGAVVYNNLAFKGGGIFVRGGRITSCTVQHNAGRNTNVDADLGYFDGSSEADNVVNTIAGAVGDTNFHNPTSFYGVASNDTQKAAIRTASWALVAGSSLAGKGYEAYTTGIAAPSMAGEVVSTTYYTLDGMVTQPVHGGVYIKRDRLSNGHIITKKLVIK